MKLSSHTAWIRSAIALVCFAAPSIVFADDSLNAVRSLYAAGAYDDALRMLNRVSTTDSPTDRRLVDEYRAYCLLALGHTEDAERAIEALLTADPSYQSSNADAPESVRTAFSDVQKRMLPVVAHRKVAEAQDAFNGKEYALAAERLNQALDAFADSGRVTPATELRRAELSALVVGFCEAAAQAIASARPPEQANAVAQPVSAYEEIDSPLTQHRIFGAADVDVKRPVAVRLWLPLFAGKLGSVTQAIIEVVVDETGAVESATMRVRTNTAYDQLTIDAAREWKFRPATRDGLPVKYLKVFQINLKRRSR